jgi:hypothetical protein
MSNAYYAFPTTSATVVFAAVKVEGGRKFRGRGFIVGESHSTASYGWRHTGYGWAHNIVDTYTSKIWVPELGKFCYANSKYVEEDPAVSAEECAIEFKRYADQIINDTIAWCRKTKPEANEAEIAQFARNILCKNHKELKDAIDTRLPDTREIGTEIEKTIAWAMTLKTQPCHLYGRFCPGGKPLAPKRIVEIARKALVKKGLDKNPDFEQQFENICRKNGLTI